MTFIALFDRDDISEAVRNTLKLAAPQIAKGARPQTSPLPLTREIDMRNPFSNPRKRRKRFTRIKLSVTSSAKN